MKLLRKVSIVRAIFKQSYMLDCKPSIFQLSINKERFREAQFVTQLFYGIKSQDQMLASILSRIMHCVGEIMRYL